ncbi:ABC transporter ATP-binding protein [Fusibacter sp. Q10-2]|uniref:ABC transporter ATP-binding protein n=1 Tax=Fusibacter ferrireducens TaxID=2785058 RepID=A0ABR9ZSC2_9FIRM|nr:ABC transporter ATP-binding protein [Fusibacter ferrireducens]
MSKNYKEVSAVNDFNFEFRVEEGRIYVIKGKSGSGKSTLLNLIGLIDSPSSGTINIKGVTNYSKDIVKSAFRRDEIGFVFQEYNLNGAFKAFENIMVPMLIKSDEDLKTIKIKAFELLKQVGLEKREHHYPNQLSGGEKQRVAIARALANNPPLIIADEPTANLDQENEQQVLNIFNELKKKGKVVIVASHSEAVWEYADVLLTMQYGSLVEVKYE